MPKSPDLSGLFAFSMVIEYYIILKYALRYIIEIELKYALRNIVEIYWSSAR